MRASEYGITRINAGKVEFKVETEHFGEELRELGIEEPTFYAHIDDEVHAVRHKQTLRDVTSEFDTQELLQDILFAAMNEPNRFFGGEVK